jgi:RimJ/RimL family protein N-acetyltransferase
LEENIASGRVLEKTGMELEGTFAFTALSTKILYKFDTL